ncbi:MAG: DUF1043 family protein [Halieaceae bacterium]|nr:DUF1043 family protein [Halieaceae bacterium]
MYSFPPLFLAIAFALLAGIGAGLLASRHWFTSARKQRQLERSLEQLSQQQREYRHAVVKHFTDTASQLNKLADSYRDVHNQLAAGARALADSHSATLLQPLPDRESTDSDDLTSYSNVQQPLDYAPKNFPQERGMLNEEFGLNKIASNEAEATLVESSTERS